MYKPLLVIAAALLALPLQAADLKDLRIWAGPDSTRVVFDLDAAADHALFTLQGPDRIVIDLQKTGLAEQVASQLEGKGVIQRVRTGKREGGGLRVVLDVSDSVRAKSFSLPPSGHYGHRVVVDLYADAPQPARVADEVDRVIVNAPARTGSPTMPGTLRERPIVIAIDAGHGGEDPGARGPSGVLEKDVALRVARQLKARVDAQPGFSAVMIRDGDYYVGFAIACSRPAMRRPTCSCRCTPMPFTISACAVRRSTRCHRAVPPASMRACWRIGKTSRI